jgi:WD40 repeat protein/tetratricopeptide (TPR) repeat protein
MLDKLIEAVLAQGSDRTWEDIADAVWLSAFVPPLGLAPRNPTGTDVGRLVSPDADERAESRDDEDADRARSPQPSAPIEPPAANVHVPNKKVEVDRATGGDGDRTGGRTTGGAGGGGLPLQVPSAPALPDALAIGRALRPLSVREPSLRSLVLDEEATIRQAADFDVWVPALRPGTSRMFELALVIDDTPSRLAWDETLHALRTLLDRLGAFRDVRGWWLQAGPERGDPIILSPNGGRPTRHSPEELRDPSGRRIILVASDCSSAPWRDGRVRDRLEEWGRTQPVAVVQMLPRPYWRHTGLGRSAEVTVQSRSLAASNARLMTDPPGRAGNRVPIPVLLLEPEALASWAMMVTAAGVVRSRALLLTPAALPTTTPGAPPPTPDDRVARFLANASTPAQELAACLAVAPLHRQVIRLVQHTMVLRARNVHLAEVLLGGLIEIHPRRPGEPELDFFDGVRERLLDKLQAPRAIDVITAVSRYLKEHFGSTIDFPAILEAPKGFVDLIPSDRDRPFAQIAAMLLRRLGDRFTAVAVRLEGNPGPGFNEPPEPVVRLKLRTKIAGYSNRLGDLAWSADGSKIAVDRRGIDRVFDVWDLSSETPTLLRYFDHARRIAWSLQDYLAVQVIGEIQLHRLLAHQENQEPVRLRQILPKIRAIAWSPDGSTIAIGNTEGSLCLIPVSELSSQSSHESADLTRKLQFDGDLAGISHLAWSPDGRLLAVGFSEHPPRLVDTRGLNVLELSLEGETWNPLYSVHSRLIWWPGGRYLAFSNFSAIRLIDMRRMAILDWRLECGAEVGEFSVSADGRLIATVDFDPEIVRVWRCDTREVAATIGTTGGEFEPGGVAFHPKEMVLAALGDIGREIHIWNVEVSDAVSHPWFWWPSEDPYPIPSPPEPWTERPEQAQLRERLTASSNAPIRVGIWGADGFGKTALAAKVARDPAVRAAFPDGVIWFAIDSWDDFANSLEQLSRHLELAHSRFDREAGAEELVDILASILSERRCLLVADAVSDSYIGDILLRLGATAMLFVATKRDALAVLGIVEVFKITPLPPRSPADYADDLDRLTLFPSAPSSFSVEAAAAVLSRDIEWTLGFLEMLQHERMGIEASESDRFSLVPPLSKRRREHLPENDPSYGRFVDYFVKMVLCHDENAKIRKLEMDNLECAIDFTREDSRSKLNLVLVVIGTLAIPEPVLPTTIGWSPLEFMRRWAGMGIGLALELNDERELKLLIYCVRQIEAVSELDEPTRKRLVASGHLDSKTDSILEAFEFDERGERLLAENKLQESEEALRRALSVRDKVLKPGHPEIARGLAKLAEFLSLRRREYHEAEALAGRGLKIREAAYGPAHIETARGLSALAAVYRHWGRTREASELTRRALEIRRTILGEDHPETLRSIAALGSIERHEGRFESAKAFFNRVMDVRLRVLGFDHPETLQSLAFLAALWRQQGLLDSSEGLWAEILDARVQKLGPNHPDTIRARRSLEAVSRSRLQASEESNTPSVRQEGRIWLSPFWAQAIVEALRELPAIESPETISALIRGLNIESQSGESSTASPDLESRLKAILRQVAEQGRGALDQFLASAAWKARRGILQISVLPFPMKLSPFTLWRENLDTILGPAPLRTVVFERISPDAEKEFLDILTWIFGKVKSNDQERKAFLNSAWFPEKWLELVPWNGNADRVARLVMAAAVPHGLPAAVGKRWMPLLLALYDQLDREIPANSSDRTMIAKFDNLVAGFRSKIKRPLEGDTGAAG